MNAQKTGRLLLLFAAVAVTGTASAHASGTPAPARPAPAKAVTAPAVIVKLGDAMLEEYHNGDSATRTTMLRGGDVAQKAKSEGGSGKKHS